MGLVLKPHRYCKWLLTENRGTGRMKLTEKMRLIKDNELGFHTNNLYQYNVILEICLPLNKTNHFLLLSNLACEY